MECIQAKNLNDIEALQAEIAFASRYCTKEVVRDLSFKVDEVEQKIN